MFLNPTNSKRKIFGLYEYCLNSWLAEVSPKKDFLFDVGSNTGYDLYGLAHLLSNANQKVCSVIGFEPDAADFPELTTPLKWPDYSMSNIEILEKFVGAENTSSSITLDRAYSERAFLSGKSGLIKIDVEGAEIEVLRGAQNLLNDTKHDWLIEIHGSHLISRICEFFVERSRPFLVKDLAPLPIIGKEKRSIDTYWLLTIQGYHDATPNA